LYSGKPAAGIVVADLLRERNIGTARRLNEVGVQAVDWTAEHAVELIGELLGKQWDRCAGEFVGETLATLQVEPGEATCSCGSGIPVQKVNINGQVVTLIALPAIFQQFREQGKVTSPDVMRELLDMVKIYNPVSAEAEANYLNVLEREYAAFCAKENAR
jgi:hypothetical protein